MLQINLASRFVSPYDRDKSGSMPAVTYAYFCFSIAFEYMNMRRFMVVRPNDELKAVDEKDGWHGMIIPVRLGYSTASQTSLSIHGQFWVSVNRTVFELNLRPAISVTCRIDWTAFPVPSLDFGGNQGKQ